MDRPDYHRFRRGDRCSEPGCPSKYWYIDSGQKICQLHGHVQEGFTQIQQDEDDFNTAGKRTKRKKEKRKEIGLRYEGRNALGLYVECLMVVLRLQVEWMVANGKIKGREGELEEVVRALWAARLRGIKGLDDDRDGYESQGGFSSTSASEGESDAEGLKKLGARMEGRLRKLARDKGIPKLLDTVCLVYLAFLLLREPISFGDLGAWMKEGLPYFGVIKEIPQTMLSHLPAHYLAALSPRSVLSQDRLQARVLNTIIQFKINYEIQFPPLNASLLMFKHVKNLLLPLEIYACAFRLANAMGIEFKWPEIFEGQVRAVDYPELRMMGLVVVSVKLLEPLDDVVRKPESIVDPASMRVRWESWKEVMAEKKVKGLKPGEEVNVSEKDVFEMTGEKLDDYLHWYQKTWMDDKEEKLPKQILDLFPLPPIQEQPLAARDEHSAIEKLKVVQGSLQVVDPVTNEQARYAAKEVIRPGSRYPRWKEVGVLSETESLFMEKAAELAGCSLDVMVKTVYMLETKLEALARKADRKRRDMHTRRENAMVISSDESSEDDDDEGDDEL